MRCVAAWERGGNDFHFRPTEERLALEFEAVAEFGRLQCHPGWRKALPEETPESCEPEAIRP